MNAVVTPLTGYAAHTGWMPNEAPLELTPQDLSRPFRDPSTAADCPDRNAVGLRAFLFVAALTGSAIFLWFLVSWLAAGGFTAIEILLSALIGSTNLLITFYALTAIAGLFDQKVRRAQPAKADEGLDVALLMLTYNEAPAPVFARAAAICEALAAISSEHRFRLYILSDTRDPSVALQEEELFLRLRGSNLGLPLHYRRRTENTDRKIGNLHDWVGRYGGGHDAMLVLDADSLMTAEAIVALADEMAADASLGIAQSAPDLIGGTTLFARLQGFATAAFGPPLARGLARWTGRCGNFWGHNALLRLPAFAQCALLPRIGRDRRLILSHDFVEAALMRRAGWSVRFFPHIGGSYETAPPGLVEWALRDRRWAAGNLQHLSLLATAGLHPISRLHFLLGAAAYLMSPAWLVVLAIWALHGNGTEDSVIRYFSAENPLYPVWPEASPFGPLLILALTVGMLLTPKVLAFSAILVSREQRAAFGDMPRLFGSFLAELVGTVLIAPILMVQQSLAILASLTGRKVDWQAADRDGGGYALRDLLRFHRIETVAGTTLFLGWLLGSVTPWLLPIAFSLALAVPISFVMSRRTGWLFQTPNGTRPPDVWQRTKVWEEDFARSTTPALMAAE